MPSKPKPQVSKAVTSYNAEGLPTKTVSTTPLDNPDKRTDKQKREDARRDAYTKLGVYKAFLSEHPEMLDIVKRAIKNYMNGTPWDQQRFNTEYEKTQFAQDRTKAQEYYDLNVGGPNADVMQQKVAEQKAKLIQTAQRLGVPIDDAEAQRRATEIVRDGIEGNATLAYDAYFSKRYLEQQSQAGQAGKTAVPQFGTASEIQRQLTDMARSYGLKMDPTMLQTKTGQVLGQGERWQEYLSAQNDMFRQQAKLFYPKVANLFDTHTLDQIAEPYLAVASDLLGLSPEQMDTTDPKWTAFLNGENGALSVDEWTRVLKTDPRYGWDHSLRARREFAGVGDEMLAAFGMA